MQHNLTPSPAAFMLARALARSHHQSWSPDCLDEDGAPCGPDECDSCTCIIATTDGGPLEEARTELAGEAQVIIDAFNSFEHPQMLFPLSDKEKHAAMVEALARAAADYWGKDWEPKCPGGLTADEACSDCMCVFQPTEWAEYNSIESARYGYRQLAGVAIHYLKRWEANTALLQMSESGAHHAA